MKTLLDNNSTPSRYISLYTQVYQICCGKLPFNGVCRYEQTTRTEETWQSPLCKLGLGPARNCERAAVIGACRSANENNYHKIPAFRRLRVVYVKRQEHFSLSLSLRALLIHFSTIRDKCTTFRIIAREIGSIGSNYDNNNIFLPRFSPRRLVPLPEESSYKSSIFQPTN